VSSKHGFRRRVQTIVSQISVNSQRIDWNETYLRPLSGGPKELQETDIDQIALGQDHADVRFEQMAS